MSEWRHYHDLHPQNTVCGTVKVYPQLYSPQLDNRRDILVYLPPSYSTDVQRRYPVVYMHDGQNLFDRYTSYVGEWQVDETMEQLAREGLEAIIVGIPHMGDDRVHELSPFTDELSQGRGADYLSFIVQTVKPLVDSHFRTAPQREKTGIAGSSMGGLISLWGLFAHSDIFGFAGIVSPAFWFGERAIYIYIENAPYHKARIWMDVGTREAEVWSEEEAAIRANSEIYVQDVRRMRDVLRNKGYDKTLLAYLEDEGAIHNEGAWAKRFPDMMRFLLGGIDGHC